MPYHSVSNQRWDGFRGHQPANLTLPRRHEPSVKDFMFLYRVIYWPRRAPSSYYWVRRTRLAGEDGRPTCTVHVPVTEVHDYTATQWRTCIWVLKPFANLCVANSMFPPNLTNTSKTTVIEDRQPPNIFCLQRPGLWTIQQDWANCRWVYPTLRGWLNVISSPQMR